jgi:phospholipase C
MIIAKDSTIVANSHHNDPKKIHPPFNLPSLPENLEKAGLKWKNFGGYTFNYITNLKHSPNSVLAGQFSADAAAGNLANVSWVYGPKYLSDTPPKM